jgi:hypothetical protein
MNRQDLRAAYLQITAMESEIADLDKAIRQRRAAIARELSHLCPITVGTKTNVPVVIPEDADKALAKKTPDGPVVIGRRGYSGKRAVVTTVNAMPDAHFHDRMFFRVVASVMTADGKRTKNEARWTIVVPIPE